ncbi:hypothetical protein QBC37DRAFT_465571 [Rhypophila decipiens]|uniref:SET domain-containing protein n=1 Tax=Rhypophila decipiens TaxID=261697 RepID=A0AAN7B6E1_9PEZI|nr:hypothetical protein QBC37DRAFT_465571 [Rhypophila decipiens]
MARQSSSRRTLSAALVSTLITQGSDPTTFSPWTHRPFCLKASSDPWCVYTNADTSSSGRASVNHGISIITTPELASGTLNLLKHVPPTGLSSSDTASHSATRKNESKPCQVKSVTGKGLGAIATRRILKGEKVLVDRVAVLSAAEYPEDISRKQVQDLLAKAVEQLPEPEMVLKLSRKGRGEEQGFSVVEDLLLSNSFLVEVGGQSLMGLFGDLARFNHACEPNTNMRFSEKTLAMTIVASRDIEPGEELTISYIDATLPSKDRQSTLQKIWGFRCTCPLCRLSRHQRRASDERRTEIQTLRQETIELAQAGKFHDAIGISEQLIKLIDQEGLTLAIPDVYDIPAALYYHVGNLVKAREYNFLSLMALQELGVEEGSKEEDKVKMIKETLDKIEEELSA